MMARAARVLLISGTIYLARCVKVPPASADALAFEDGLSPDIEYHERSPEGWLVPRKAGAPAAFELHIAKTAGSSFARDVPKYLSKKYGFFASEMCYPAMASWMATGDVMMVMLRSPASHVYSQYLECRYSPWGQYVVQPQHKDLLANVSSWLAHFTRGPKPVEEAEFLGCYHPLDMQTRTLACISNPHEFVDVGFDDALSHLQESSVIVGLTEHYQASVCLFLAETSSSIPAWCHCENQETWNLFNSVHIDNDVPKHSLSDLSPQDLEDIKSLTVSDERLYAEGVRLFRERARRIEDMLSVKILCE